MPGGIDRKRNIDDLVAVVTSVVVESDLSTCNKSSICDSVLGSPFKLYALCFTLYAFISGLSNPRAAEVSMDPRWLLPRTTSSGI